MIKILRAIRAEQRKLWSKRSTFAWVVLCMVFSALFVFVCNSSSTGGGYRQWIVQGEITELLGGYEEAAEWKEAAENEMKALEMSMHQMETQINAASGTHKVLLERELQQMERQKTIAEYRVASNIRPENERVWGVMRFSLWVMVQIAAAVVICAAADMFGGEYARGTIYMNLARPVTRIKQYTAKLVTAGIYAALLIAACFVGVLAAGTLLGETKGVYVGFINGEAYHKGWIGHLLEVALCGWAMLEMCVAICAAAGTLTRSGTGSAMTAIAVMIVSIYFGKVLAPIFGIISGISIFACMDLTVPLIGTLNHPDMSFNECVVSLAVHFMLFSCAGYGFMRKDIG